MEASLYPHVCNETSIDTLLQTHMISVRAYNTCRRVGIHNAGELAASHRKDTDWMHISRCGTATAFELTSLVAQLRKSLVA